MNVALLVLYLCTSMAVEVALRLVKDVKGEKEKGLDYFEDEEPFCDNDEDCKKVGESYRFLPYNFQVD